MHMNNESVPSSIVSLFHTVEAQLHHDKLEPALSNVRSILAGDPHNLYAGALERRLRRILEIQQNHSPASSAAEYSRARVIAALEHICRLAVQHVTTLAARAPVQDMTRQLREQALEDKHQALMHRARQKFHTREFEHALQEAERAKIIRPDSAEVCALIMEIKKHLATPEMKSKQRRQFHNGSTSPAGHGQQPRGKNDGTTVEQSTAATEKILASISYADYYRTNGDFSVCLRYIAQGLELDPSNEVLLQMKEEIGKKVEGELSQKKTSSQLA